MFEEVKVNSVMTKLITVAGRKYLCNIALVNQEALCNGECLETGEKTGWISIKDTNNPDFSFGEYIKENLL